MRKSLKIKWVEAMEGRSKEKYYKGKGRMVNSDDCFCPLGILCNVSGVGEWVKEYDNTYKKDVWMFTFEGEANDLLPPNRFLEWAGLTKENAASIAFMSDHNMLVRNGRFRSNTLKETAEWVKEYL